MAAVLLDFAATSTVTKGEPEPEEECGKESGSDSGQESAQSSDSQKCAEAADVTSLARYKLPCLLGTAACVLFLGIVLFLTSARTNNAMAVEWWLSTQDGRTSLAQQPPLLWRREPDIKLQDGDSDDAARDICIDPGTRYQEVLGIGTSLEASTAFNIARLEAARAADVLQALFHVDLGIGFNLARVTIGTSDFAPRPFYSYDDTRAGATDPGLVNFSLAQDDAYVLPLILAALGASGLPGEERKRDGLLLFASPWSPPAWMKTSRRLEGGYVEPRFRKAYALYLHAFVEAYAHRGVTLHALTVQNEPLAEAKTYPTARMGPEAEREVIGWLGPMLQATGLSTRIWCFDHNWSDLWYPKAVLSDSKTAKFIDGTGFHFYTGSPSAMTELHELHPDKHIIFTEGSTFGAKGAAKIVEIFRNWATTYTAWVTMLDSALQPNAGPFKPSPTMLILNNETLEVQYRFEFHMYGHFSKFIRRGAVRIASNIAGGLLDDPISHVAFANSEHAAGRGNAGSTVIVVVNTQKQKRKIRLRCNGYATDVVTLSGESIATFRWRTK